MLGLRVLCRVGQAFRHDVKGGHLERFGEPWQAIGLQLHLKGRDGDEGFQSDCQSVAADDRRMQAAGNVSQLAKRFRNLAPCALQPPLSSGIIVRLFGKQAQFKSEGNQPLLRTVVEISFQAATLVLLRLDDPTTRALKLLQPRSQLGFQAAISKAMPAAALTASTSSGSSPSAAS